jgi:hypothetical protein
MKSNYRVGSERKSRRGAEARLAEERKPAEATSSCGSEGKRTEATDSGSHRKLTGSPAEAQEMAEAGSLSG